MGFVLDIIVIAILVLSVVFGVRKGFARSLIEVVGAVAAIVLAFTLSLPLSTAIYDNFVEQPVAVAVDSAMNSYAQAGADQMVDNIFASSEEITRLAALCGVDQNEVKSGAQGYAQEGTQAVAGYLKTSVIRPALIFALRVLVIVVLAILLLIIVKIIARLVGKAFSFSLVGAVDKSLGGVLGFVKGGVLTVLFCIAFGTLITMSASGLFGFTQESVNSSFLFKTFAGFLS